ncbi:MAG TPA: hypothetical protein PKM87_05210 [Methanolinea sp.]|nr:hypothetical protein [Methanolinea sp.]
MLFCIPCLALALLPVFARCVDERGRLSGDYLINEHGCLSLECPACTLEEKSFPGEGGYSVTRVAFHTPEGDVDASPRFLTFLSQASCSHPAQQEEGKTPQQGRGVRTVRLRFPGQ